MRSNGIGMKYSIQNERLKVTFRYDPNTLFSQRFESIGVVEQVCLDRKHFFCEPEQRISYRATCHGIGLCGEYVWDELAERAGPGELFPKIGVGLLRQRPEGGRYHMWKHYEVFPYPTDATFFADRAIFVQACIPCLGIEARLTKEVTLHENELHMRITLENLGVRRLALAEYQHNFLSLDGIEVGPGYRLEVPFAKSMAGIESLAYDVTDIHKKQSGFMTVHGNCIDWNQKMEGHGFHMAIPEEQLDLREGNYWKLSHSGQRISVLEKLTFSPSRLVLWGAEHCVSAEVYIPISVEPGQQQSWTRIWRFSEEGSNG